MPIPKEFYLVMTKARASKTALAYTINKNAHNVNPSFSRGICAVTIFERMGAQIAQRPSPIPASTVRKFLYFSLPDGRQASERVHECLDGETLFSGRNLPAKGASFTLLIGYIIYPGKKQPALIRLHLPVILFLHNRQYAPGILRIRPVPAEPVIAEKLVPQRLRRLMLKNHSGKQLFLDGIL